MRAATGALPAHEAHVAPAQPLCAGSCTWAATISFPLGPSRSRAPPCDARTPSGANRVTTIGLRSRATCGAPLPVRPRTAAHAYTFRPISLQVPPTVGHDRRRGCMGTVRQTAVAPHGHRIDECCVDHDPGSSAGRRDDGAAIWPYVGRRRGTSTTTRVHPSAPDVTSTRCVVPYRRSSRSRVLVRPIPRPLAGSSLGKLAPWHGTSH